MGFFKRLFQKSKKERKKDINKRIKRLIKARGLTKELKELKATIEKEELKDMFFNKLLLADYAKGKKKKQLIEQAKRLAEKIPELKDWPKNSKKFWDIEAYGWLFRIPKRVRFFIKGEMLKRIKLGGLNLAIGCGSYPYVEDSVLLDLSEEMLKAVPTVMFKRKILHDIDKGNLPFKDCSFDNVTAVFVVDYLKNVKTAFKEVKRVLRKNGRLIIVQSKKPISELHRMHEKRFWKGDELKRLLELVGFKVIVDEKKIDNIELVFVEGVK